MEFLTTVGGSILSSFIESVLNRAIEKSGDNWVSSRTKVKDSLKELHTTLSHTKRVVSHAERQTDSGTDTRIIEWVENLKNASYDADNVLDEIEYEETKVKITKQVVTKIVYSMFNHGIITKINEINKRLKDLEQLGNSYKLEASSDKTSDGRTTTSFLDNRIEVFGRDGIRDIIIQLLIEGNLVRGGVPIISIVGMGGIGKTTLAQIVYNHDTFKNFSDLKVWVCVSDDFNERKIINKILESVCYSKKKNLPPRDYENLDVLARNLVDELKGNRYFIILDDVWNDDSDKWQRVGKYFTIDEGNRGSRVLITTRNQQVADIMPYSRTINLDGLPDDVVWPLFQKCAFGVVDEHPTELEEVAKKIVKKLRGSPLAVKTVGHILNANLSKRHWEDVLNNEIWTLTQNETDIMPALRLSYQYLHEHLKPCFAFCSLYPKDYIYEKKEIIYMWMALGYINDQHEGLLMEEIGEKYVNELLARSMFQACSENDKIFRSDWGANDMFKIHDLIHDLAKMVSANESIMIQDGHTLKRLSSSTRHLSIFIDDMDWDWDREDFIDHMSNIRTLVFLTKGKVSRDIGVSEAPDKLYVFIERVVPRMKFLRILDLSHIDMRKLPLSKVKHLRYLNLTNARVRKLPSLMASLYQLQVLHYNSEIPRRDTKNMLRLRHPVGFGFRTGGVPNVSGVGFLQELKLYVARQPKWVCAGKQHKLKCLKGQEDMRELRIYGLENVESKDEAQEAELRSMGRLTKLALIWGSNDDGAQEAEEVLQGLQPSGNVRDLEIKDYPGAEFPEWMKTSSLLEVLHVDQCRNVKFIGTSGLDSIKRMKLVGCPHMRIEAGRFRGFEAFTSLEILKIWSCPHVTAELLAEDRGGLPSSLKKMKLSHYDATPINASSRILQSLTNLTNL